ncbi:MAG TPA: hypothetical protein VM032_12630 [Vicinamibacterales bacterium]|nr:hypothetical protein [Vicinamibacterales bacterium]
MHVTIGAHTYQLVTLEHEGQYTAHAIRGEHGDRFGIEATGASAQEALDKLTRWLAWQHEHTLALEALQLAERVYHRALADAAFSTAPDGAADSGSRSARDAVDTARTHLDDVRAQCPNV